MFTVDSIKSIFLICKYNLKKVSTNPRVYIVLALLFMFLWYLINPFVEASQKLGIRMSPWTYSHISSDSIVKFFFMIGLVIVFVDAPFVDDSYKYILIRSGRKKWIVGQVMYILITTAIYFIILFLLTIILSLPNIFISANWGKFVTSMANNPINTGSPINFQAKIITLYSPIQATFYSLLLDWMVGSFLSMVTFIFSLKKKKIIGIILSCGIMFLDLASTIVVDNLFLLTKISPLSIANLNILETKNISGTATLGYSFTVLPVCLIISMIFAIAIGRKTYIDDGHI